MKFLTAMLCSSLVLSCSTLISKETECYTITDLCLNLVKGEYTSFLTNGRTKSAQECIEALHDALTLIPKNRFVLSSPTAESILQNLDTLLKTKIEKIEYQLHHKNISSEDLAASALNLGASLGAATLTYYYAIKPYLDDRNEYWRIRRSIPDMIIAYNRVIVSEWHDIPDADRVAHFLNTENIKLGEISIGSFISMYLFFQSIKKFVKAFDPNHEIHYLSFYRELLREVEKIRFNSKLLETLK